MLSRTTALATVTLLLFLGQALPDEEQSGLNDEGFLATWLLMAPIPLENGQSGDDALNKEQLPKEAKLQPKAGDKVKVGGEELVCKKYQAKAFFFDFNAFLGKPTEDSVGYAVATFTPTRR